MPDGVCPKTSAGKESTLPQQEEKLQSETQVVNVAAIAQRVNDASIVRRKYSAQQNRSELLSHTPWKLKTSGFGKESNEQEKFHYPTFTYLDLRRTQNSAWSMSRLQDGVQMAKSGRVEEAEACYKEGLELDPSHAQLLVAYGALAANLGRVNEGLAKLTRALEIDPHVANGREYLTAIQQRLGENNVKKRRNEEISHNLAISSRSDAALKDAEVENSLYRHTAKIDTTQDLDLKDEKYLLLSDGGYSDADRDHEKKRKKKKKKKHRKRECHDYSDESYKEFKTSRRKKKRKRR
mmetsp:Transcript_10971/g.16150  ORF Transcript_10971/g.16150 Transcript_10971/m.16150 type:complete len:294 (-) Transcript_10971:92-973(-)